YKKIATRSCPRVLGLDEHSFNRKVGYATTFCDLAKHKIFDVVEGRSEKDLEGYLNTLEGKDKVQVVCIDLSSSYRKLIRRYFPNAMIVAVRFHVIRFLNQFCLQTYQQIDPEMKYQRGLLAALRTNPNNLTVKRLNRRERYLQQQPV
ncbi:TPA: ISL3 family transposase, partial [Legionella pneumophila]|nr:ISL3 family transposase [Legionella pneumophila]